MMDKEKYYKKMAVMNLVEGERAQWMAIIRNKNCDQMIQNGFSLKIEKNKKIATK